MSIAKTAIVVVLAMESTASLPGCRNVDKATGSTVGSKHLTFVLPPNWEHKPGSLMYRLQRQNTVVRFLAIDEEPAINGSIEAKLRQLRIAFPSTDRIVESEDRGTWNGHPTLDLTWHGKTKSGANVRGEEHYMLLNSCVASVLWYAPVSEWDSARSDMAQVIGGMRLK